MDAGEPTAAELLRHLRKGRVLAAEAVETQGDGGVLATKAGGRNARQRQCLRYGGSGNTRQSQCLRYGGSGNTRQRQWLTCWETSVQSTPSVQDDGQKKRFREKRFQRGQFQTRPAVGRSRTADLGEITLLLPSDKETSGGGGSGRRWGEIPKRGAISRVTAPSPAPISSKLPPIRTAVRARRGSGTYRCGDGRSRRSRGLVARDHRRGCR